MISKEALFEIAYKSGFLREKGQNGCADWIKNFQRIMNFRTSERKIKNLKLQKNNNYPEFTIEWLKIFILYAHEKIELRNFSEKLLNDCDIFLYDRLCKISFSALINYKEDNIDFFKDNITKYMLSGGIEKFFRYYPVLARLITTITLNWIKNTNEFFSRLYLDIYDIQDFFHCDKELSKVTFGLSDTHNGGKSVALLEFENKNKILYKPRSMSCNKNFKKYLSILKIHYKTPKFIDKEDYGWEEFIEYKKIKNYEEFFLNTGRLLAALSLSNASDVSYDNIVAYGIYPLATDTETFASASFKSNIDPVINFQLNSQHSINNILPNGKTAKDYVDYICKGFREVCERIIDENIKIPKSLFSCDMRFTFRPNIYYKKMLDNLVISKYLKTGSSFSQKIDKFSKPCEKDDRFWPYFFAERKSLENYDVPYLTIKKSTKDLWANGVLIQEDAFNNTINENLKKQIEELNQEKINIQEKAIRLWITSKQRKNIKIKV